MRKFFVSEQVEILLQRMREHPEDFFDIVSYRRNTRWHEIVSRGHFNAVERLLISIQMRTLAKQKTKEAILETLIEEREPTIDLEKYMIPNPVSTVPSGIELKEMIKQVYHDSHSRL